MDGRGSQQLLHARAGRGTCRPGSACASAAPGLEREERGADRKSWPRQDRTGRRERRKKTVGLQGKAGQGRGRSKSVLASTGFRTCSRARHAVCGPRVALLPVGGPNRNYYIGKYCSSNTPYSSDARALQSIEAKTSHCEAATRITSACEKLKQLSDKAGIDSAALPGDQIPMRDAGRGSELLFSRVAPCGVWVGHPAQDAPCPGRPAGTPGRSGEVGLQVRQDGWAGAWMGWDGMGWDWIWIGLD